MPMTGASIGTALAALAPFFEFLRPTRSPYLLVVMFSVIGLLTLNVLFDSDAVRGASKFREYWYSLAAPIFLVIVLLTLFVFLHREREDDSEDERNLADQHLKFSRSICISTAVICLVAGCWYALKQDITSAFFVQYIACMCQIAVFTIYAAARLSRREPIGQLNHFQIALVTSLYLLAATACLAFAASKHGDRCGDETLTIFEICAEVELDSAIETGAAVETEVVSEEESDPEEEASMDDDMYDNRGPVESFYLISYCVFLLLWVSCQYYWIRRLVQMIQISVKEDS